MAYIAETTAIRETLAPKRVLLHPSMTLWLAEEHITQLSRCAVDLERIPRKELKAIERRIKKTRQKSSEREELESEWCYVDDTLSQSIRYALFVALYGQFEQALYGISEDLRLRFEVPLSLRDIAGQGIRLYQTFFKKVLQVSFPDDGTRMATAFEIRRVKELSSAQNHLDFGAEYR